MKNKGIVLCFLAALLPGAVLCAQEEKSFADKLSFSLEFEASVLSANTEGVVDSFTDAGFNEDETKIGLAYEDELWGASAALKFGNENLRFLSGEIGDMFSDFPLKIDELYAWVRPFGSRFKFTAGIFENTDGLADYTDDIDDFDMGVFFFGEDGEPFAEPTEMTNAALVSGLLSEAVFGPVTLQFLLAPNYSKETATLFASDMLEQMGGAPISSEARFFRLGGRVIADLGVGTFSALFKTFQWPTAVENGVAQVLDPTFPGYLGTKNTYNTFGFYFDLTMIENLGLSLGYTGFLPVNDGPDVDNILYSGIDLRAAWTGIEGLSLSTHNNITFAKGKDKDWFLLLGSDDASFFTMYNAVGGTKELNERFSVNAELSNLFVKTDYGLSETKYNTLGIGAKFIANVGEHAEFNVGARVDIEKTTGSDTVTTFSIPVGIVISF
jgi:hypothetical protein